ncbi:hypothetical protein [Sinomonas sp. P47F7]|uniref:hypothetical protein n=1 Tax=Sinomonas sp. P47F7 TaxID=3410987 RepID=UPI003BF547DD
MASQFCPGTMIVVPSLWTKAKEGKTSSVNRGREPTIESFAVRIETHGLAADDVRWHTGIDVALADPGAATAGLVAMPTANSPTAPAANSPTTCFFENREMSGTMPASFVSPCAATACGGCREPMRARSRALPASECQ